MGRKVFLIGHITNDTEPFNHLGGAVSYSGVALKGLGLEAHIITKCPPNHPYIKELEQRGVIVHNLPVRDPAFRDKITTFKNIEDEAGHRRQAVTELQEGITIQDVENFPDIPAGSRILIAPVIQEVDLELLPAFSPYTHLAVMPQGYFRYLENGEVKRRPWKGITYLSYADFVILSDEDLTFNSELSIYTLSEIRQYSSLVVLTEGAQGLTVYERDKNPETHIEPFTLEKNEIKDKTGAGDSFAAAFTAYYMKKPDPIESSIFGAYFSALKIKGIKGEGLGIQTIPTFKDIINFTTENIENYNRYQQFLRDNGIGSLYFLPEGQNHSIERI